MPIFLPKDIPEINTGLFKRAMAIRCDTRSYFNVRSKANISQLNLPYGTKLKKWKSEKLKKSKNGERCLEVSVNNQENLWSQSRRRKKVTVGRLCKKGRF